MDLLLAYPYSSAFLFLTPALYIGKKYFSGKSCHIKCDMSEKIVVVTGASSGIGMKVATTLAQYGASIIFACKNQEKTNQIIKLIKNETENEKLEFMELDLADLNSVHMFCNNFKKKYKRLDILINNAGIINTSFQKTKSGFESNFGINHLGHFLLTNNLLDMLIKTPESRVIQVSSQIHEQAKRIHFEEINKPEQFTWQQTYAQSKLANILFAKELQRRLQNQNVKVVSVHPGVVRSDIARNILNNKCLKLAYLLFQPFYWYFTKSSEQGAQTIIYCCFEDHDKLVPGGYYKDCKLSSVSDLANNLQEAQRLWDDSVNQVDLI